MAILPGRCSEAWRRWEHIHRQELLEYQRKLRLTVRGNQRRLGSFYTGEWTHNPTGRRGRHLQKWYLPRKSEKFIKRSKTAFRDRRQLPVEAGGYLPPQSAVFSQQRGAVKRAGPIIHAFRAKTPPFPFILVLFLIFSSPTSLF